MYLKWKLVLVRLEVVLVLAQDRRMVLLNAPREWKSFWAPPMVLRGVVSQVEARVGPFGGSVSLSTR